MTSDLPDELRRSEFQEAIVQALQLAYSNNQERYAPEIGHDAISFGSAVWRSSVFSMIGALSEVTGVSTSEDHNSLSISTGRCRLRVHKLGLSEEDEPKSSFPNSDGPASRMGGPDRQLSFDFGDSETVEYFDWVIGHYGSATEGLRAVRLQAVGGDRLLDERITKWEAIYTIFDASVHDRTVQAKSSRYNDVVETSEPVVRLRIVKNEGVDEASPA
jgi:hypothetical protein